MYTYIKKNCKIIMDFKNKMSVEKKKKKKKKKSSPVPICICTPGWSASIETLGRPLPSFPFSKITNLPFL